MLLVNINKKKAYQKQYKNIKWYYYDMIIFQWFR